MRLYSTIIENGVRKSVADVVSRETLRVHSSHENDRLCVLFLREPDRRGRAGELFVFQIPPQSLSISRETATSVQDTRHGYVVSEAGLRQPTFTLQGHFGWRLRKVRLPEPVKAILHLKGKGDQYASNNFWVPVPWLGTADAEGLIENATDADGGVSAVEDFSQTYDGRTAFFALRDIIVYYHEQNQRRLAQGKAPMEMVFIDPQHSLRWVVSPKYPDLKRTVETQGTYPYTLELIGVYDDSRRRKRYGEDFAWSFQANQPASQPSTAPSTAPSTTTPPTPEGGFIGPQRPVIGPQWPVIGPQLPQGTQLSPAAPTSLPDLMPLPPLGTAIISPTLPFDRDAAPFIGPQPAPPAPYSIPQPPPWPLIGPRNPFSGPSLPTFMGPGQPIFVGPQVPPYLPAGPIEPIGAGGT